MKVFEYRVLKVDRESNETFLFDDYTEWYTTIKIESPLFRHEDELLENVFANYMQIYADRLSHSTHNLN